MSETIQAVPQLQGNAITNHKCSTKLYTVQLSSSTHLEVTSEMIFPANLLTDVK